MLWLDRKERCSFFIHNQAWGVFMRGIKKITKKELQSIGYSYPLYSKPKVAGVVMGSVLFAVACLVGGCLALFKLIDIVAKGG